MGYTTDFGGGFDCSRPLTFVEMNYINAFAHTRRMKRFGPKVKLMPDPLREAVGLPIGREGEFYVGLDYAAAMLAGHPDWRMTFENLYGRYIKPVDRAEVERLLSRSANGWGGFGQTEDSSVLDYNRPPSTQPGLWCQWVARWDHEPGGEHPTGTVIEHDGGEKFYNYVEWVEYLILKILDPWGVKLNGEVYWYGEDPDDRGLIVVENNVVSTKLGRIVYD